MSGMKKTPSTGGGSAGKPKTTAAPAQKTTMMSFFQRSTPAPTPAPAAAAPAPATAAPSPFTAPTTPPRSGIGAAAGAAVAAGFFGSTTVAPVASTRPAGPAVTPTNNRIATPPTSAGSTTGRKRKEVSYKDGSDDEDEAKSSKPVSGGKKVKKEADDAYGGESDAPVDDDDDDDVDDAFEESDAEERKTPAKKAARAGGGGGSAGKASSAKKPTSASKKAVAKSAGSDEDEDESMGGGGGGGGGGAPAKGDYNTDFLLPANRLDANKRKPGAPGYDPTTLFIDEKYMKKFTPAERQYWEIKKKNMDLVLFFKIGKFYEMFDDDAAVGVKELDLSYMVNSKRPHAGFPELSLNKYAERLVALGYKIGQVDQTQTPEELKAANAQRKSGDKQKAVDRQLSSVLTPGTLTDGDLVGSHDANHLLAMIEMQLPQSQIDATRAKLEAAETSGVASAEELAALKDAASHVVELGFTYVDCTTGQFTVGQRFDDHQRSFLRTLLAFVTPREIVTPLGRLSRETQHVLECDLRADTIRNESNFPTVPEVVADLEKHAYWAQVKGEAAGVKSESTSSAGTMKMWPTALADLVHRHQDVALSSFGATVAYLRRTLHDVELLTQRHIVNYEAAIKAGGNGLGMDGQTMINLEVTRNTKGTTKGTLLEFVDRTESPFGKRLIKEWLMRPLLDIDDITRRQDAVAYLMAHQDEALDLRKGRKALPDLERGLSRVHANGVKKRMKVIMYEDVGAKQMKVFLTILDGFSKVAGIIDTLAVAAQRDPSDPAVAPGGRLHRLMTRVASGGLLPEYEQTLGEVRASFNMDLARKSSKVQPYPGHHAEYDSVKDDIAAATSTLDKILRDARSRFAGADVKWVHKNKERYQLEVPVRATERGVPQGWELVSSSKAVKRYWTAESKKAAAALAQLELKLEVIEKDLARLVFAHFAQHYQLWSGVVEVLGELDCLLSLAHVSAHHAGCVRPEFVSFDANGGQAKLNLRQAAHPTLYEEASIINKITKLPQNFIPNDTVIGCDENPAKFVLVSGPNMGGKSTLLRQTCCAVILAQMGCWVPSDRFELTPVDRIFTRVGASDKILEGHSTFQVELLETAHILKNATERSLVILDELGRGTSTFDGTAIAYAVIKHLRKTGCLTLFATHYHMLMDEFLGDPSVSMYHMSSQLSADGSDVTFLYKFIPGICPKSYGGNVARAAGLKDSIVRRAQQMSENFEKRCVEAMSRNRAELSASFPAQSHSSKVQLPSSTLKSIVDAAASNSLADLFKLKLSFEHAKKMHAATTGQAPANAMQE